MDEKMIDILNKVFRSRWRYNETIKVYTDGKNTLWKTPSGKYMKKSDFSIDVHDVTEIIQNEMKSAELLEI